MLKKGLICIAILCWLMLAMPVLAATISKLGDRSDGSLAGSVHLIELFDAEDEKIAPDDDPLMPFSTKLTCGACHGYDIIKKGWHFNAADPEVAPGRPGQPWILVDPNIATQIPLSYRQWPGTYNPEQLGLTTWQFAGLFARHMPGGGPGELESDNPDEVMRSFVSGKLEINCLSCHEADPAYNQAEYAAQVNKQNFRWAPAAACRFANVTGSAEDMPDTYDPLMPGILDDPKLKPPTIKYREHEFDNKNQVFFDITKEIPDRRCYFCHSNKIVGKETPEKAAAGIDVHLAAGLTCIDCHGNELDHDITRGYENEASTSHNPLAATASCTGCHLEHDSSDVPMAGRTGAPVVKRTNFPLVHFEKLTCTACHSGPWPAAGTRRVKTSRAHALGTYNVNKADAALPHIITPVFAKNPDGKIGPHNLIWPAFWGSLEDHTVTPISLEVVELVVGNVIGERRLRPSGDWLVLKETYLTKILTALTSQKAAPGRPVYISGGKLYQLNAKGELAATEHEAARPYLWPIAHDIRPAAQALGARGCQDCHAGDAPFFFGKVAIDSPVTSEQNVVKNMYDFQDIDVTFTKVFALMVIIRPYLAILILAMCAIVGAVVILYGFIGLRRFLKLLAGAD